MRHAATLLILITLASCGGSEPAPEEGATAGPTLADFAGTWENTANLEGVDDAVRSTMTGTAAGDDWSLTLEGRPGIPMQVSIVGDSLVAQSEEYESILRPGVMVSVRSASVLHDDMLMGNMTATYRTPAGEQVVPGTITGRRVQR